MYGRLSALPDEAQPAQRAQIVGGIIASEPRSSGFAASPVASIWGRSRMRRSTPCDEATLHSRPPASTASMTRSPPVRVPPLCAPAAAFLQ